MSVVFYKGIPMCTSIIVGEKATADGSFMMARSADRAIMKEPSAVAFSPTITEVHIFLTTSAEFPIQCEALGGDGQRAEL